LRDASARHVWRLGIEDLADTADATVAQVLVERRDEPRGGARIVRERAPPCVDEGSEQPRPDCALMVRSIAAAQIAVILRVVVHVLRAQRAQPERRQQLVVNDSQHGFPVAASENRMRQRDCNDLVWPARRVVAVLAVDDVEQMPRGLVPEAAIERVARLRRRCIEAHAITTATHAAVPVGEQAQRVVPEGIDLHRFAAPRCDHPIADLGVHPRELESGRALAQQAVVPIDADAEARAGEVALDDLDELR